MSHATLVILFRLIIESHPLNYRLMNYLENKSLAFYRTVIGLLLGLFLLLLVTSVLQNIFGHKSGIKEDERSGFAENIPFPEPESFEVFSLNSSSANRLVNYEEHNFSNSAGRTTCMVIDKTDSNHILVGTATGGLWRSRNRGVSWALVDDHAPTLNVRNLIQDYQNPGTYYYSAYENFSGELNDYRPAIFKSTDTGKTFQILKENSSTDWSYVFQISIDPSQANTLYAIGRKAGFGATHNLYRSFDGGNNFEIVYQSTVSTSLNNIHLLSNGKVFVVDDGKVYSSASGDSGTYSLSHNGMDEAGTYRNLTLTSCLNSPNRMYALAVGGTIKVGVFKSTDAGKNWSYTGPLNSGVYTSAIGVKHDDPDFVLAGSVGLNVTTDGGETWQSYQAAGVDYWSVNYDLNNPDIAFVTYDGGVARFELNPFRPNPWDAVTRMDSLLRNTQIHSGDFYPNSNSVLVGMQDIGTAARMENGTRYGAWGNDGSYCYVHNQDTSTVYVSYQNGRIMKKENLHVPPLQPGYFQTQFIMGDLDSNGDRNIDEGAHFIHPFWVNRMDGEQLYFPTKKRLWRSLDGGDNWRPISENFGLKNYSMRIAGTNAENPILYVSVNDTLYITPDAKIAEIGDEFKVAAPSWIRSMKVSPQSDSVVYILANESLEPKIYQSSNLFEGNVEWTLISLSDLPEGLSVNCMEVDPENENQIVVGTSKGLYTTVNRGLTWEKELCFPNVNVKSCKLRPKDGRLFFFTYGRGAWSAEFPETQSNSIFDLERESLKLVLWPNPASDKLHIGTDELNPDSKIEIYNLKGDVVLSQKGATQNPVHISVSGLSSGWYSVRQSSGTGKVYQGKFLKVR